MMWLLRRFVRLFGFKAFCIFSRWEFQWKFRNIRDLIWQYKRYGPTKVEVIKLTPTGFKIVEVRKNAERMSDSTRKETPR